jgi:Holliday junction resolvase
MNAARRRKGARVEREIVERHRALGVHAERVPLSGGAHYQGNGGDVDLHIFPNEKPLACEVKARKNGAGFTTLDRWLGENDALFLRKNQSEPIVVLPWRTWAALLQKFSRSENTAAIPAVAQPPATRG